VRVVLLVVLVYLLSLVVTFYHNKMYFVALKLAKTKGSIVSTGKKKGYFSKGSIVIIACDDERLIRHGEILEGRTILAKFKPIEGIEGLTLQQVKSRFNDRESIMQAIGFIEDQEQENEGMK